MHEYSIIIALIEQCEKEAKKRNALNISKVIIQVGDKNGVDTSLLTYSFDGFKQDSDLLQNAKLEIQKADGRELYLMNLELDVKE